MDSYKVDKNNNGDFVIKWFTKDKKQWWAILNEIKKLDGRRFNPKTKEWSCPATEKNLQDLVNLGFDIQCSVSKNDQTAEIVDDWTPPWKDLTFTKPVPEYLREYQIEALRFLGFRNGRGLIADEMGCISGDAIIKLNRNKRAFTLSLEKVYERFHNVSRYKWNEAPTYVRCLKDGHFGLNLLRDVLYQGEKKVLQITLGSGKTLKLTPDHEVISETGDWKEIGKFNIGESIMVNGMAICKNCGTSENLISYKYAKYIGYCKKCAYKLRDLEKFPVVTKYKGNDGYIYLRGAGLWNHPRSSTSGLLEHIYLMELHLDRPLHPDEEVHHINKIKHDNRLENLEVLSITQHRKTHDCDFRRFGNFIKTGKEVITIPKYEKITKIECAGITKVYDLVMDDPHRNFIANGIVVHNCGKTVEALGFLKMSEQIPALIIVPATIKKQWYNQFRKFVDKSSNIDILFGQTTYPLNPNTTYIINWDILHYWLPELNSIQFKTLIADECHRAANTKAKRTKALRHLSKRIPYFLPMSGTPIKARPKQFYSILNMLDPTYFGNEWKYLQRYCGPKHNGFGWSFDGASNLDELHKVVRNYMIRRETKDVLKELPEKVSSVIPLDISENMTYYQNSLDRFKTAAGIEAQKEFANLKLEAFALKQDFVVKWIEDFIESGRKILIGTYHRKVIEFLQKKFDGKSVSIYGGIGAGEREKRIHKFVNHSETQILFGQILSAGEGIDGLQDVCSDCAFVEFAHNPADHSQFEARLHRSGQKDSVNSYWLIADGTIESDLVEILDTKRAVFDEVINGRQTEEMDFISYLKDKYKEIA